jgi:hypothetical protein
MSDESSIHVGGSISGTGIAIGQGAQANVHYHERRRPLAPRQAPALPSYFVERLDYLEQIRSILSTTDQIVVAITGLEGEGKTTLASAVAKYTDEHFSDGVLWGEFNGRPNDIGDILRSFLPALDVEAHQVPSQEDLFKLLRSTLAKKRVLVVLDNVATMAFEPASLLTSGSPSRILFTTADRALERRHAWRQEAHNSHVSLSCR